MDLLEAVILALNLGPNANDLAARCKRSKNHQKTFVRLLEQINECGHFIQSYIINDCFCTNCYSSTYIKVLTFSIFQGSP